MHFFGELVTVGDLLAEDMQPIVGVPAVQVRTADGRIVTITGLTRDEAGAAAEHFGDLVAVNLVVIEA